MISTADKKEYYDNYWLNHKEKLNAHEIIRLAEIFNAMALVLNHYKDKTDLEICDLGCGRGWLSQELSKFGHVTGIDLSEKGIGLAQNKWKNVSHFEVQDILKWRPDKKYDIVVSSEVIEHIQQKDMYAETMVNILKPNGFLILTTPNGRAKKNWDAAEMGAQIVEEWITPQELRVLFSNSMELISLKTFIYDFCYNGKYRIIGAPKLLRFFEKIGLMPVYNAFLMMANLGLYQVYVARFNGR
jgi:2-polyprenyl-3-methyl-5-hydroxy-6-metoxy-1,4-benzoquinol methylase